MAKTIKSFNVEKEVYDQLMGKFKKHGASTSLSFFVEQCLVRLLKNLSEAEEALKGSEYYPEIMKFVIEKSVSDLVVTTEGIRFSPEGSNAMELNRNPKSTVYGRGMMVVYPDEPDSDEGWLGLEDEKELEGLFWIEEYEAAKQNLPRCYARLLKTGKYELSRDKRFLIEKGTGKRYIRLTDTHVVEVAADAKLIGPADEM